MRLDFWHAWKLDDGRLFAALIGSVLFGAGAVISYLVISSSIEPRWFVAHVEVPDHFQGEDPMIRYERQVLYDLTGSWTVQVEKQTDGGWQTECRTDSSQLDHYGVEERRSPTIRWSKYVGAECAVEPGTYRLRTVWEMALDRTDRPASEVRRHTDLSNIFRVIPRPRD